MANARCALVVEQDPDIAGLLADILGRDGYRTLAATCGSEALAIARTNRPDLIVIDAQMNDMDAFAFRSAVESEGLGNIQLLVVNALLSR